MLHDAPSNDRQMCHTHCCCCFCCGLRPEPFAHASERGACWPWGTLLQDGWNVMTMPLAGKLQSLKSSARQQTGLGLTKPS